MEKNKDNQQPKQPDKDIQSFDTLLILYNHSNTIGIVKNINPDGTINQTSPDQEHPDPILKIDQKEDAFSQFYSDF